MHKILKKTIKYGAAVLLTLIAVILTGIGYLYLSADMMTPQFASTPETDRVIRKDSLRQYGGNYLRHSESGLWELKVSCLRKRQSHRPTDFRLTLFSGKSICGSDKRDSPL